MPSYLATVSVLIVLLGGIGRAGGVVRTLAAGNALALIVLKAFTAPAAVVGRIVAASRTTLGTGRNRGAALTATQNSHTVISFLVV